MIQQNNYENGNGNHPSDHFVDHSLDYFIKNIIKNILLTSPNKLIDEDLSLLYDKYVMSFCKLSKHLKEIFGYNDIEYDSVSQFINLKFGKNALKQIHELLLIKD